MKIIHSEFIIFYVHIHVLLSFQHIYESGTEKGKFNREWKLITTANFCTLLIAGFVQFAAQFIFRFLSVCPLLNTTPLLKEKNPFRRRNKMLLLTTYYITHKLFLVFYFLSSTVHESSQSLDQPALR